MKKNQLITVIFSFVLIFQISCVSVQNKKELKNITLKILLSDKLTGSRSDKLPADLDSIFLPFEPLSCPKIAFIPDVEIIRIGLSREYRKKINTDNSNWRSFFQKFYGNNGSQTRKKNINDAIKKITIGDTLVLNNIENFNLMASLENMINSNPDAMLFLFRPGYNQTQFTIGKISIPVFSNIDTLRVQVGKKLCEKTSNADKKTFIIYNPAIIVDTIPPIPPKIPDEIENQKIIVLQPNRQPEPKKPPRGKTLEFNNGDVYVGEVLNGKPDGNGVMTFKKGHQISELDIKKQMAEAGDYLVGVWRKGEFQTGKLHNSAGQYRCTITVGGV